MKISTIYVIIYVQKFQKIFYIKAYSIIHATRGQPSSYVNCQEHMLATDLEAL